MLVTSRYTGEWIAPKGSIEAGESREDAARREAREEAGVEGRITGYLGSFPYLRGLELVTLETYLLEVELVLDDWPEQNERRRRWFTLKEALDSTTRQEVKQMLEQFNIR
jgi:uncharacterized protein